MFLRGSPYRQEPTLGRHYPADHKMRSYYVDRIQRLGASNLHKDKAASILTQPSDKPSAQLFRSRKRQRFDAGLHQISSRLADFSEGGTAKRICYFIAPALKHRSK